MAVVGVAVVGVAVVGVAVVVGSGGWQWWLAVVVGSGGRGGRPSDDVECILGGCEGIGCGGIG